MCTAINVCEDGVFGRTLDFERDFGEGVVFSPRGSLAIGEAKNRYAMLGIGVVKGDKVLYFDGLNEWGLSGAALNFQGYAVYKKGGEAKENIPSSLLISYVLGLCKSVNEAESMLKSIFICDGSAIGIRSAMLHWMFADKNRAIVVEATERGVEIWDNPYGVLTNSPDFAYHKTRLADYMQLHSGQPENRLAGAPIECYSRGMGAIGLPGDFSSSSRFVRASFIRKNTLLGGGVNPRIAKMKNILSSLSVPLGCVKSAEGKEVMTRYISIMDGENLVYYFSSYSNSALHGVRLVPEDREIRVYPIYDDDHIKMLN